MVNNLKLSIIVLTHSGNDTLYQCLYSIKNQTFKKFKCIVIGYDTTDVCQTIARTICKQDNRFSYIPINGKSLCYAKNLGISLACNDYTMFIQDNDFLQQDCFEKAVFFIRKYNPQILWTASIQYTSDNYQSNINTHINGMYTAADMPFAIVERCYIYDKIYQTSLLKNIRFIDTVQEQVSNIMFNHDCLIQTNRVVNINYRLMHHYTVENECNINNESKTQLIQYIDKVNDDNVKKSIELIIQHGHRQLNYIEKEDTLIVSFTSWKKRIQYCKHVVDLMMKQTTLPDKIILNLSEEEFPNKYNDLPKELIQEEKYNTLFEIYWVKENTTVWKKIIPTMNRFPQALVFSIDDDIEYPNNYISEMYNTYCENNKCCPVVAYEFMIDDNLCHSGPFTLTSKKFYDELLDKIYDELIYPSINERKWQSDIVYYKVANSLGYKYVKCENIDGNTLYRKSQINKENKYSTWDKEYKNERNENIKLIDEYIKNNKSYPFGVSICLSAYKVKDYIEECLDSILNQTYFVNHNNYEILLGIDNCQETLDEVNKIKYKYNNLRIFMMDSNVGTYVVANTIMSIAKYSILIRFDTDDIMRPNMVEEIINNFNNCDIITYNYQNFGNQTNSGYACGSHSLTKKTFIKWGGYQAWRCAADYDFLYRMNRVAKEKHIKLTYLRRVHENSLEFSKETDMKSKLREEYHNYIKNETRNHRKIECITSTYKEIFSSYNSIGKKYNNEKGVISLTSWKKRINNVYLTIQNLLKVCPNYHIVLVLSEQEFINKEKDLPNELLNLLDKFELLWVYKNYKAFKKILFTMDKYRDVPIISADDDCIYFNNYADNLYETWENNKDFNHFFPRHSKMVTGCGACSLYSPYCFKNAKDLLNDEIINTLEDDMFYQYLIDKMQLKQYYMVDKWPFKQVNNNDALSLEYKSNLSPNEKKINYYKIYDKFTNLYLLKNEEIYPKKYNKPIVSFTSYKERLPYCINIINSILENTIKPYKIILNLYKDDVQYINKELHNLIYHNIVELYICNEDLRPHKKYFYTMLRYKDNPIITIDDDVIYPKDFIESLINSYKKYPNCVSARRVHKIKYKKDGTIDLVKNWTLSYTKIIEPSFDITHSGVGGVLYPPDILKISEKCLPDILKYISVDDKYIMYLERCLNIKTVYVPNNKNHPDPIKELIKTGLCINENENGEYTKNDICINELINNRLINRKFYINKFNYIPEFNQYGNIINTNELKTALSLYANKMIGKINLDEPKLIYEKINWLKIYDVSYVKAICSDKVQVHNYCKDKLGYDICIPLIKVYDSPEDININELPNKFVLKCNHGYKMNIICDDKEKFNLEEAKNKCKEWLQYDFGHETLQYQYSLIDRKCFIEEYMTNGDTGLTDYKIWCQNGIPYFIMVINDRYNGKDKIHANIYDLNWNKYDLGWKTFKSNYDLIDKKPKTLNLMIEYAKKLSEDFKFIRVDFYEINGKCYLGELTFTPDNGFFHFNKDKEIELGNLLNI